MFHKYFLWAPLGASQGTSDFVNPIIEKENKHWCFAGKLNMNSLTLCYLRALSGCSQLWLFSKWGKTGSCVVGKCCWFFLISNIYLLSLEYEIRGFNDYLLHCHHGLLMIKKHVGKGKGGCGCVGVTFDFYFTTLVSLSKAFTCSSTHLEATSQHPSTHCWKAIAMSSFSVGRCMTS